MPRSGINSASRDLIRDNGAVLISVVQGEQIHIDVTLNWFISLANCTLTAKVVEADCSNLDYDNNELPVDVPAGAQIVTLDIIDDTVTDNTFKLVIPQTLVSGWTTQPEPEKPTYGWIDLEVQDDSTGSRQQIWKPVRGLVEVLYSPTEEA